MTLNFSLKEFQIEEVEIVAESQERIEEKTEMSVIDIPVQQIKKLPALLGEVDVIKACNLCQGSNLEMKALRVCMSVEVDQIKTSFFWMMFLFIMFSHLGGFFSVFNADAIKSVKLTKGGFPARYGGRLSSVLDIRMKEGNMNKFQGGRQYRLISSKLSLQGPIIKNRASLLSQHVEPILDLFSRPQQQNRFAMKKLLWLLFL